jgi:hypothetical protein
MPLADVGRQATPARARPQGLEPHQPLDPMQPARYAVGHSFAATT